MSNLSTRLYGTLNWIHTHRVTLETLQKFHGNTLNAVVDHKWVERHGSGAEAVVVLSAAGEQARLAYSQASLSSRQHPGPLTDRCAEKCAALLRVARMARVFQMPAEPHRTKRKAG